MRKRKRERARVRERESKAKCATCLITTVIFLFKDVTAYYTRSAF
jgi:hypothetical protein